MCVCVNISLAPSRFLSFWMLSFGCWGPQLYKDTRGSCYILPCAHQGVKGPRWRQPPWRCSPWPARDKARQSYGAYSQKVALQTSDKSSDQRAKPCQQWWIWHFLGEWGKHGSEVLKGSRFKSPPLSPSSGTCRSGSWRKPRACVPLRFQAHSSRQLTTWLFRQGLDVGNRKAFKAKKLRACLLFLESVSCTLQALECGSYQIRRHTCEVCI